VSSYLITGGTGSFGSTMVKHLLDKADHIRIFSRDEAKQDAMRHQFKNKKLEFIVGDTRDPIAAKQASKGIDYVFQAAALKQVPSCEMFPLEAVKTNVDGTANIIRGAMENGVKSLVCLSTDKAVYPINAMGISKAMMEKVALSFASQSDTTISVTRYGNVMYSRGSVLPLWVGQIQSGGPVTITEQDMTRFLMTLDDSVDLVLHAFSNATSGDLFVKKAPATTMIRLAEALMEILGKRVPIQTLGARHGEKKFESLLSAEDMARAIDEKAYFRVPKDNRSLSYEIEEGGITLDSFPYTSDNTHLLSTQQTVELLLTVPEIKMLAR
jgi:UDP-N-acetylglucosamine 4,6-dehydratase